MKDNKGNIFIKGHKCFERGMKDVIYVKLEQSSLNGGVSLLHHLLAIYTDVLSTLAEFGPIR